MIIELRMKKKIIELSSMIDDYMCVCVCVMMMSELIFFKKENMYPKM